MSRWLLGGWLVVVWVALWGDPTAANLLGGVVVAAVLLLLFPAEGPRRVGARVPRPLAVLRFAGHFVVELVRANVEVAWEILTPHDHGVPGIVAVPLEPSGDALVAVVADTVTLTPGTLTLEVDRLPDGGSVLYVHCLHLGDPDEVRRSVRYLQHLALRAFGPRETPP